jgi:UBX domain-containing protein 1/4
MVTVSIHRIMLLVASHLTLPIVQSAIDWLEKNQDKSLDDIKAEEAEQASASHINTTPLEGEDEILARSLQCEICGKLFRTTAQAQFHADKT